MSDDSKNHELAQTLYEEGLKYDWRSPETGANPALARAAFERAASLHHTKALCELAEMMFAGSGGAREQERALLLKWHAARLGEVEALDELSALLGSYAEEQVRSADRTRAERAAQKAEQAHKLMSDLGSYIQGLSPLSHLSVGQA